MTREELNEDKQEEILKEENRKARKKVIKKIVKYTVILIIFLYAFFFYAENVSTVKIVVNEERITNTKIPISFNGLKIIHFSDLHYGSNIDKDKVKEVVTLINKRKPDIVVFTGDLIDKSIELDNKEQESLITELQKIDSPLGKYAIIGDEDKDNYSTIMNQCNFVVLNNEYDLVYNKTNDALLITGFSSSLNNTIDINKALDYYNLDFANTNIYSIGLLHEPDSTDDILNIHQMDLLLAGHSHNGNVRIPFIGSVTKRNGAKKYDQAYYKINNSKLYISSGIGTQDNGIRLFCRPSINFYRLSNS
ncbi:MAG: metallophosphoesterase [Bacilli bacterium]|nr:metallophosphoesterase [Bacilli bacterium]